MRLLLASDLHCDVSATKSLLTRSKDADVLVVAGDLANARQNLDQCLKLLKTANCPVVLVPGNNESDEELLAACQGQERMHVLHGTQVDLDGVTFFGLGGGVPITPYGPWSFDLSEEEAGVLLDNCPENAVLIVHSPPQGVVDVASNGKHLGSTAIKQAIRDFTPQLVVCGHIHASGGKTGMLGTVPVVNAGPYGILWDLATRQAVG